MRTNLLRASVRSLMLGTALIAIGAATAQAQDDTSLYSQTTLTLQTQAQKVTDTLNATGPALLEENQNFSNAQNGLLSQLTTAEQNQLAVAGNQQISAVTNLANKLATDKVALDSLLNTDSNNHINPNNDPNYASANSAYKSAEAAYQGWVKANPGIDSNLVNYINQDATLVASHMNAVATIQNTAQTAQQQLNSLNTQLVSSQNQDLLAYAQKNSATVPAVDGAQFASTVNTGTLDLKTLNTAQIQILEKAGLVATGGGNIVSTGGGKIISSSSPIVASGAGNLVGPSGGTLLAISTLSGTLMAQLVASGGGNLKTSNGTSIGSLLTSSVITQANLISQDGGSLIGNAGGTLIGNAGGTLIGNAGGTLQSLGSSSLGALAQTKNLAQFATGSLSPQAMLNANLIGNDGSSLISGLSQTSLQAGLFGGGGLALQNITPGQVSQATVQNIAAMESTIGALKISSGSRGLESVGTDAGSILGAAYNTLSPADQKVLAAAQKGSLTPAQLQDPALQKAMSDLLKAVPANQQSTVAQGVLSGIQNNPSIKTLVATLMPPPTSAVSPAPGTAAPANVAVSTPTTPLAAPPANSNAPAKPTTGAPPVASGAAPAPIGPSGGSNSSPIVSSGTGQIIGSSNGGLSPLQVAEQNVGIASDQYTKLTIVLQDATTPAAKAAAQTALDNFNKTTLEPATAALQKLQIAANPPPAAAPMAPAAPPTVPQQTLSVAQGNLQTDMLSIQQLSAAINAASAVKNSSAAAQAQTATQQQQLTELTTKLGSDMSALNLAISKTPLQPGETAASLQQAVTAYQGQAQTFGAQGSTSNAISMTVAALVAQQQLQALKGSSGAGPAQTSAQMAADGLQLLQTSDPKNAAVYQKQIAAIQAPAPTVPPTATANAAPQAPIAATTNGPAPSTTAKTGSPQNNVATIGSTTPVSANKPEGSTKTNDSKVGHGTNGASKGNSGEQKHAVSTANTASMASHPITAPKPTPAPAPTVKPVVAPFVVTVPKTH
jgi:hypothetical protein